MRISDWSSDVCSSDLCPARQLSLALVGRHRIEHALDVLSVREQSGAVHPIATVADHRLESLRLITELILRTLTAAIEIFGQQHDGIARDIRFAAKQRCRPFLDGGISKQETRMHDHRSRPDADKTRDLRSAGNTSELT